jgi:hypothetical protein
MAPAGLTQSTFSADNGTNSQTWFNLIGAVDPNNAITIVVGGLNLARSTDGGDNWTTITTGASVHVDQHALVYDGSAKLISGNDGGIYYSTNINAATPVFLNKNTGYNVTQYYACDFHPTNTNYFLAGAQDNGTQKFISAGMNTTTNVTGGDGGFCHIDKSDGQLQITAFTANNYNRSTNGEAVLPHWAVPLIITAGNLLIPVIWMIMVKFYTPGMMPGNIFASPDSMPRLLLFLLL